MAQNPSKFRYVHYIATRILLAEELATQQQIERLVDSTNLPMAYELNALYRDGATMNTTVAISGTTVTLTATDTTKPMLVFCRGIWEPFTTTPIALGSATSIFLNYVVISQAQISGDAEMAELQLSLATTSTAGAPNTGDNELERNPVDITVYQFTNAAGVAVLVPQDNTYPAARGRKSSSGLVALTTSTSAGTALASDDMAVTNQRIPVDSSVTTAKVVPVTVAGTNTDGSAKVNPTASGQGGIQADHLIFVNGTQTVEAALTAVGSSVSSVVSSLSAHIGRPLGPGVHPMPNYIDVGAAPISHVGAPLDNAHQPTLTNDHAGFIVTRNPAVAPANSDLAYMLRNLDGSIISGLLHNGDIQTPSGFGYQYISSAYAALFGHVSQTSHANPHGLALSDLGGVSVGQEQADIANILAAAQNYANNIVPGLTVSAANVGAMAYFIFRFAPNNGNAFEIAIGTGTANSNETIPLPNGNFSYTNFRAMISPGSGLNGSRTINNITCQLINGNTVNFRVTDNNNTGVGGSVNVFALVIRGGA